MSRISLRLTLSAAVLSAAQLPTVVEAAPDPGSAAPQFTVAALEDIPSGTYTVPIAINNVGQVLGWAFAPGPCNPLGCGAIWNSGKPTILGSVKGALFTRPVALNDLGQAAGLIYFNYPKSDAAAPAVGIHYPFKAAVWNGTEPTLLGSSPPEWSASVTSINDEGETVGYAFEAGVGEHGIVWSGTQPLRLHPCAYASVVNNKGDIACNTYDDKELVLISETKVTPLPQLAGEYSDALGINDSAEIVGDSSTGDGVYYATYWHDGKLTVLNSGSGGASAQAINAHGKIVGSATTDKGRSYAAFWPTVDSAPIDLNTAISASDAAAVELYYAVGINDKCQILVAGLNKSEHRDQSYVLTPTAAAHCR